MGFTGKDEYTPYFLAGIVILDDRGLGAHRDARVVGSAGGRGTKAAQVTLPVVVVVFVVVK